MGEGHPLRSVSKKDVNHPLVRANIKVSFNDKVVDGYWNAILGPMYIGTSAQEIWAIYDTGSSWLWLQSH